MKNFVQPGKTLTLVAPYDVVSGGGMLVGALFAIAANPARAGEAVEGDVVGVYRLPKADAQAWTQGAKIYWDNTAKVCTTASSGNALIGAATQAVANTAGLTVGEVRLNGVAA